MDRNESKILIVEDEIIVAMEMESLLQSNGFSVVGKAHSSEKAVDTAIAYKPNIILMDINIKGEFDGIDTCKKILNHLNAKIIFVSAYNDEETHIRIDAIQPHYFLPKPYSEKELIDIISSI